MRRELTRGSEQMSAASGDEDAISGGDRQMDSNNGNRNAPTKRLLQAVAVQAAAAAVTAAVHIQWARRRLGDPGDVRPYVFLLGGACTVAVAVATLRAEYRRLYALGAGTLSAFVALYWLAPPTSVVVKRRTESEGE